MERSYISQKMLLKEYYNSIKEDYPNLSLKEFTIAVKTAWEDARQDMRNGKVSTLKFKGFGTFKPSFRHFKMYSRRVELSHADGNISEEDYKDYQKLYKRYIDAYGKDFIHTEKYDPIYDGVLQKLAKRKGLTVSYEGPYFGTVDLPDESDGQGML